MGVQQQKPQPHRNFGNIFHFEVLKTVSGISNSRLIYRNLVPQIPRRHYSCFIMAANQFRVCVRGFSSSTVRNAGLVKPPCQVSGTEGRYAAALFSAASKNKALDVVEKDLNTFQATVKKDKLFAEFLADPSIKKSVKVDGIAGACDKLKMSPLTKNLFAALAENGRHNLVDSVIASYGTIMAAQRGEIVCEVVTAKALDPAMVKEVEAVVALFLKKGEKSKMNYKVDPAIIGGMVVSIGDKFADMSIASKMKKYTDLIQAAA